MRTLINADNQAITHTGIVALWGQMVSAGEYKQIDACSRKELIASLLSCPDAVVVLDYTLFDIESADELLVIRSRFPQSSWLLFSDNLSEPFLRRVLLGYEPVGVVLKTGTLDELTAAIRTTLSGERYICQRVSNLLLSNKAVPVNDKSLTPAEIEILREIASGKTTKEIAQQRNLSTHTIISHRKNIFRKLEVNNRYEATRYAVRAGIVDLSEYYI